MTARLPAQVQSNSGLGWEPLEPGRLNIGPSIDAGLEIFDQSIRKDPDGVGRLSSRSPWPGSAGGSCDTISDHRCPVGALSCSTCAGSSRPSKPRRAFEDAQPRGWLGSGLLHPRRMKSNRAHRVPLSGRAMEILRQARGLGDGEGLVFPGARAGRPLADATLSWVLRQAGH